MLVLWFLPGQCGHLLSLLLPQTVPNQTASFEDSSQNDHPYMVMVVKEGRGEGERERERERERGVSINLS